MIALAFLGIVAAVIGLAYIVTRVGDKYENEEHRD